MTDRDQNISDEELTAFLDDELDPVARDRIAQAIETDMAVAARLEALDAPVDALRNGMSRVAEVAPAPPAFSPDMAQPRSWRIAPVAAAIVVGLLIGAGGMAVWQGDEPRDSWQDYAAAYHLLYRAETLADITPQTDFTAVSEAIGLDLTALVEASDIPILRAQILGFGEAPIIQLAYLRDGTPYAFCITLGDGAAQTMSGRELDGLETAYWSNGTHQFLLIGGEGAGAVAEDAAQFQSLL